MTTAHELAQTILNECDRVGEDHRDLDIEHLYRAMESVGADFTVEDLMDAIDDLRPSRH